MIKKIQNKLNLRGLLKTENIVIFIVVAVGVFLRFYQLPERFLYGHDQDLAGWFVKDVLINNHLRLIGQETSTAGIYIGPYYYYLITVFYKFFGMDPIGGAYLVFAISLLGIWSLYFVVNKIWGKRTAVVALTIYSLSYYLVFNDREVVPTMPVIIWTIWLVYTLHLILSRNWKKGFVLSGVLSGLVWHLNFALVLPLICIPVAMLLSKKRLQVQEFLLGVGGFVFTALPFFIFELRHGFSQTHALVESLTTTQSDVISGSLKYHRVFSIMSKNLHGLLVNSFPGIKPEHLMYFFVFIFIGLAIGRYVNKNWAILFTTWTLTTYLFFANYSKIISEYYVNGSLIVFLIVSAIFLTKLFDHRNTRHIGAILIFLFAVFAVRKFAITSVNESGYIERQQIISEIKRDSETRGYPCVSLSYITDAGYNLGYRYFIFLDGLKTKPVSKFIPVYTVVFPLKPIFETDQTRGAIGLIYPDYEQYNPEVVNEKCAGDDYNLSEPMWGFPQ